MSKCCRIAVELKRNQWDTVHEVKVFSDLFLEWMFYIDAVPHPRSQKLISLGPEHRSVMYKRCAYCVLSANPGFFFGFVFFYCTTVHVRLHLHVDM